MRKKLFNIHKLIGINIILFFFISTFFGVLTIFQPYVSLWEDSNKHFKSISTEKINLDKCVQTRLKDKNSSKDFIEIDLPSKELRSTNLMEIGHDNPILLNPTTCEKIKEKEFFINDFFNKIHTGGIFNSLLLKIIFGFASVAVVFLSISGLYLIYINSYRNTKTKTIKGFYAKYHRLLLFYTLPLVFMFGLTGALFNLGVYSSPLITNYLTQGSTSNVLKVERNILSDKDLEILKNTKEIKTLNLNFLYEKAKKEFDDISFYEIQIYNYNDINAKVKFIGYEPKNFFVSSRVNETYVILKGSNGELIEKKEAKDGSFVEKTLDSIFYLHYLRTFTDLPRVVFGLICIGILFGIVYALLLYFQRAKKDKFSYKVLIPLSFTILFGSLVSSSLLFATTWTISEGLTKIGEFYTQELIFYFTFLLMFIYIKIRKNIYLVFKDTMLISAILLILAVFLHGVFSDFNMFLAFKNSLYEIFFMDFLLFVISVTFLFARIKVNDNYFQFYNEKGKQ